MERLDGFEMIPYYTPWDNAKYRDFYESRDGGSCGLAVLAVLQKSPILDVKIKWEKLIKKEYEGFAKAKDIQNYLKSNGYVFKRKLGRRRTWFPGEKNKIYFLRIQWIGPDEGKFHGYNSWYEASCNTHYLFVKEQSVFCNQGLWFDKKDLKTYLKKGYITSYLEINDD